MGTITTLRPSATSSAVGWSAQPSGTIHAATSDDNDSTYALWSGSGSPLILATPADAPPVGERRHQVRIRARGEDGDAWWAVRLASGGLVAGAAAQFTASPGTITGSWGFGAPADGSTVLSVYATAQSSVVRIQEFYLDVDSRLAPTFTIEVLDGSGAPSSLIGDTAQPTITVGTPDLDDLQPRQYRYWVTLNGAIVWDTGVTSGPATNRQTTALDNGTYVAHAQVWSTLGSNTAYASDEETTTFTISVGSVPAPEQPTVTPVADTPFYEVEVCAPYAGDFDNAEAWVEIQRVDCPLGGYLDLPGTSGAYASTPDPGTYTTIQVTVSAQRDDDWRPAADETLAAHYDNATPNRSWRLSLDADGGGDPTLIGAPFLLWTTDGGTGGVPVLATQRPPIDAFGRVTLRCTLVVDDGAGGWTVTFETQNEDGTWAQLGDVLSNSGGGTTSLFNSTAPMSVGAWFTGATANERWTGRIYWAEMRDGAAGSIIASPDFTGRQAGTTSFTDDQLNVWTVSAPAAITSDQRITSVAILGPLDTDECSTYTDYSLPRTGVGVTCEHTPDPCCSYYRARTLGRVDGALQVSDWSDAYDPGIPNGLIFLWPSTNASIPAGWDRVTELDARYPKGIPDATTQPGTTGGAALHTHTVTAHSHDESHGHTVTGASSAAVGSFSSSDGAVGTTAIAASHTHTIPAANSATVVSGSTSPSVDFPNNDLDRFFQIFVKSNGQPLGLANGMVGIAPDISMSGWTNYANSEERFLKGAAAAGDGGTAASSTLNNHTHAIGAHTHASTAHTHTHNNASTVTSNLSLFAGASSAVWSANHAHLVTGGSTSSGSLVSGGSGTSGASSLGATEPPHTRMRFKLNTSGGLSLPVGIIGIWRGSLGSIPNHWELCDGTSGRPNLLGQYIKGAATSIGTTGGSLNPHNHTSPSHTHTTTSHTHTITVGPQTGAVANVSTTAAVSVANGTHTHTHGATDATTPTVGSSTSGTLASTTTEPLHEEVAFVQLVEEPTPPPAPEEFCLVWDDNEHLIRSENSQGPMFAAIGGIFTWDVDRPFTAATGVMGGRYVTSAPPGGRNLHLTTAVEGEAELAQLLNVLNRPLVLISPSDAAEVWAAPVGSSVKIIKIGRVRQVTADFIATGPQPGPQLADVGA